MKMINESEQRITSDHLSRVAIIYPRQSSPDQVRSNLESTRLQLGLRENAIAYGWKSPVVIEDDLGISAGGFADRPGFQNMMAQVVVHKVGIIFCFDASRLSRNSKDWASLFELCGHFDTLIADVDKIYDLANPNDRLVLGIKGIVSELELSMIRARLQMGAEAKAARGELKFLVPSGYTHDHDGKIILDPDRRIQKAIHAMFDQFDRCTSVRQLGFWYRETKTRFPIKKRHRPAVVTWQVPSAQTLRNYLKHPIFAGTYTHGRTKQLVEYVDGRLKKRRTECSSDEWRVCIPDNHPPYISQERFVANQEKIAESRPRWKTRDNLGAVRDGLALLSGLLHCGHCGKKLYVAYKTDKPRATYFCEGKIQIDGAPHCLSFGSKLIDQAVGEQLCRGLSPHAIDAARVAKERREHEQDKAVEQARLRVQAAQYEADRAFEQFDLVDPKNRLVADNLEERLNERLAEVSASRRHLERVRVAEQPLTEHQCRVLDNLAGDFRKTWNHPDAQPALKKQLLRAAIVEIIVEHNREEQRLEVVIYWQGGVHTTLNVRKRATPVGCKTDPGLVDLVRDLAIHSDAETARILNMKHVATPRGLRWTKDRVTAFRSTHRIKAVVPPDAEDYLTGNQAGELLGISVKGVRGLIRIGALHNHQVTDFAPWRIPRSEIESATVKELVRILKRTGKLPRKGGCADQQLPLSPRK